MGGSVERSPGQPGDEPTHQTHMEHDIEQVLKEVDSSSLIFFAGILLSVAALGSLGILEHFPKTCSDLLQAFPESPSQHSVRMRIGHRRQRPLDGRGHRYGSDLSSLALVPAALLGWYGRITPHHWQCGRGRGDRSGERTHVACLPADWYTARAGCLRSRHSRLGRSNPDLRKKERRGRKTRSFRRLMRLAGRGHSGSGRAPSSPPPPPASFAPSRRKSVPPATSNAMATDRVVPVGVPEPRRRRPDGVGIHDCSDRWQAGPAPVGVARCPDSSAGRGRTFDLSEQRMPT